MIMTVQGDAEKAMKERIDKLFTELAGVRTGRANPQVLDPIKVEYYGSLVPIKQVAAIGVAEGRTLEIRAFDPTAVEAIEKALQKSDIGVSPQNDGKVIRLNFPAMNEERRKDVVKMVGKIGEEYRVSVRKDRREAMEALKAQAKKENMPEDRQKDLEAAIQKITDSHIAKVDSAIEEKQKDISTI